MYCHCTVKGMLRQNIMQEVHRNAAENGYECRASDLFWLMPLQNIQSGQDTHVLCQA